MLFEKSGNVIQDPLK